MKVKWLEESTHRSTHTCLEESTHTDVHDVRVHEEEFEEEIVRRKKLYVSLLILKSLKLVMFDGLMT